MTQGAAAELLSSLTDLLGPLTYQTVTFANVDPDLAEFFRAICRLYHFDMPKIEENPFR